MKILIENEIFKHQGGSETIAIHTFEALKKRGHEVYFFATKTDNYYIDNYEYLKYFPKNVYSFKNYIKNPLAYYWNFEAAKLLKKMLIEIKPDIVHFNLLISPSIIKTCYDMGIPSVMTAHVPAPFCPASTSMLNNKYYCDDFKCKNGNYWHCIRNLCKNNSLEASIRKSLLSYIYKLSDSYNKIDYFICPSNALKNIIQSTNIGIDKDKVITINNFLSEDECRIKPSYNNKGYFLYIGRLVEEKGVHYLLEAMKDLPKNIEVHIVGTGKDENKLKNLAIEYNLDNVKFLGFKNREEIKEEYQNCIALIVPSNWFEIFGMINIEAFINGKPVIASNIGGIPEIVEDNKTGLLFEPGNVEQLKECILKYWNNPELVVAHGKKAYQKAITKYSEDKYCRELIEIYEKAITRI